jgi:hypothetical protein
MNPLEFRKNLTDAVKLYKARFLEGDENKPYHTGTEYGRYEMAENILRQYDEMMQDFDFIPKKGG